jgi:hypothetical protein
MQFLNYIYQDATLALPRKCGISMCALQNCNEMGKEIKND